MIRVLRIAPRRTLIAAAVVLLALAPGPAVHAFETRVHERNVGDHTFMQSVIMNQPFMTRYYAMTTAVGFAEIDVDGDTLDFAAFQLLSNFQQPVTENLGFTFDLTGAVIAATNGDSALVVAANGDWELGGGVVWNWLEGEGYSISLRGNMAGGESYLASPLSALQVAVADGDITTDGLLVRTKNFEMSPSLNAAYGINAYFGLYGVTAYDFAYANPSEGKSEDSHTFELGFGASIDLNELDIPFGFTLAYLLEQEMNNDTETSNTFEFGARYAPNEHFNLGLSVVGNVSEVDSDTDIQEWTGTLGIVYYQ